MFNLAFCHRQSRVLLEGSCLIWRQKSEWKQHAEGLVTEIMACFVDQLTRRSLSNRILDQYDIPGIIPEFPHEDSILHHSQIVGTCQTVAKRGERMR
jgi:hypothetical protein